MDTSAALTSGQLKSLHLAFSYLGYGGPERPYRLAAAAEALGLEQLGSFKDLTSGQAGYLLGQLRRGEIPAFGGWPHEGIRPADLPAAAAAANHDVMIPAATRELADAIGALLAWCVLAVWFLAAARPTIAVIACTRMRDSQA